MDPFENPLIVRMSEDRLSYEVYDEFDQQIYDHEDLGQAIHWAVKVCQVVDGPYDAVRIDCDSFSYSE